MNKTENLLNAIRDFEDTVAERTNTFVPDEIMSLLLQYMIDPNDYLRLALLKRILKWFQTLSHTAKCAVAMNLDTLVGCIYGYKD